MSDRELEIYEWLNSFIDGLDTFASKDDLMKRSNLELVALLRKPSSKSVQQIKRKQQKGGT